MINKLGQVMLYVNDQDQARIFWTEKLGFTVIEEVTDDQGMRSIEVAPGPSETSIVLISKDFVAEMEPDMNLDTPSLMFFTDDLDALYEDFSQKNIVIGELVVMPSGERVFNFADDEANYFAVMER